MRGAWVEIRFATALRIAVASRSPCGERGLKSPRHAPGDEAGASLPVRGAWVEMFLRNQRPHADTRRSPCGERGLKCGRAIVIGDKAAGRSPCGERGLKLPGTRLDLKTFCRSPCGERGLK